MIRSMFGCLLIAAAACTSLSQRPGTPAAEHAIAAATDAWVAAYERGDAAAVADLFEKDGLYAANTGQILRGREVIREGVQGWMMARPAGVDLDLQETSVEFRLHGDTAHKVSRYLIRARPAGCTVDAGHALSVWRRQSDARWLIVTHLVNRDPQPPPDQCPRPASLVPDERRLTEFRGHPRFSDQAVVMVNLLDFASPQAQRRYFSEYAARMVPLISTHGGSVLWSGPVEQHFAGHGEQWDYVVLVRWPSRAAFMRMIGSEDYAPLARIRQETLRSTSLLVAARE